MNELVGAVSGGLIHFLWQGAAIAVMLAIALRTIRNSAATLRYGLAVGAMAAMLVLPLATVAWQFGDGNVSARLPAAPLEANIVTARVVPSPVERTPVAVTLANRGLSPDDVRRGLVAIWFLGVVVFSLVNAGGWFRVRRIRRSGTPIDRPGWSSYVTGLCGRMGIRRVVEAVESVQVDVPTVIGFVRPVILVPPAALLGMSPLALEALLLHELAHVRRHDYVVNLLQSAVEALLFYHPAVWWVSGRVRAEREHCCDDIAVASCGSRSIYLHALAEMERFRMTSARLAVAADGGSLMERVRRLTGTPVSRNGSSARWSVGIATLAVAVVVTISQLAWLAPTDAGPAGTDASSHDAGGNRLTDDMIDGRWRARLGRHGEVWLQLSRSGAGRHEHSFTVDAAAFTGTGDDGVPGFMLRRDAGTFHFDGRLDGRERQERFEFRADPDYAPRMRAIGFDVRDSLRRHFEYAALDVSLAFARSIRDVGYGDVTIDRLVEFRIHGVSAEFIAAIEQAGYEALPPQRLVEFRIHGVSPEFVRAMADSGFEGLTPQKLVQFKIHGVSPEFVRAMADSGFEGLTPQKLIEFKIHGVSPEFVRAMADSGFEDLTPQKLVEFRIHGVSPEFVREMANAGYADLPASKLVEFRIHGVSPEFVHEMANLGLDGISARKLVELRIHRVDPEFVTEARERYGDELSVNDLIELRIHGGSRRSRHNWE